MLRKEKKIELKNEYECVDLYQVIEFYVEDGERVPKIGDYI